MPGWTRKPLGIAALVALAAGASCESKPRHPTGQVTAGPLDSSGAAPGTPRPRPGVTEAGPGDGDRAAVRETVYVPVYPYVYTADTARPFNLAATLHVRNTDRSAPIVVTAVRYYDSGGRLARDVLPKPLRVAPMAALESFVKESDVAAGASASFLVEWSAGTAVSEPVVEAVMVGTLMNQGIAFTSPGRVVERKEVSPKP